MEGTHRPNKEADGSRWQAAVKISKGALSASTAAMAPMKKLVVKVGQKKEAGPEVYSGLYPASQVALVVKNLPANAGDLKNVG